MRLAGVEHLRSDEPAPHPDVSSKGVDRGRVHFREGIRAEPIAKSSKGARRQTGRPL